MTGQTIQILRGTEAEILAHPAPDGALMLIVRRNSFELRVGNGQPGGIPMVGGQGYAAPTFHGHPGQTFVVLKQEDDSVDHVLVYNAVTRQWE